MFDNFRERWTKFEEEHESARKARIHFEKNGKIYLVGVVCLSTGLGTGYFLRGYSSPDVIQTFTDSNGNIGTIINRSKNVEVVIQYLNQRNYPANPVQCLETLEKWGSQAEAAAAKGISETNLSQHLSGKYPHVNGLHFTRISS